MHIRAAFALILNLAIGQMLSAAQNCTNQDFQGVYGPLAQGNIILGPPIIPKGPFVRMGRGVADGKGSFTAQTVDSFNGAIETADLAGTYTVTPNCSITLILHVPFPGVPFPIPVTFFGALADGGREATVMIVDPPGAAIQIQLQLQNRETHCSNRDLTAGFRLSMSGLIVSQPPNPAGFFARTGRVEFDGTGKFTADTKVSYNGLIVSESFSGAYSVDSSCLMTMHYTLGQPYVWDGMLTDNSNSANLIVKGPQGAVVTGTLKKQ